MKLSAVHWLWLLIFAALVLGTAGCATDDPDNESVRPWNAPENGGGAMPMQDEQHPE